jgi:3-methyl-2-oxobutanoate hydroxymethyltransferase
MSAQSDLKALSLFDFGKMRAAGEKIAMLTCYDASFAALCEQAGVDSLLIGDSLGNVVQGQTSTLPVTLEHMAYHTACVARGCKRPWLITDLPFGSYQESPQQALRSAAVLMAAGAHMVKLEGGAYMAETVRFLVERGIPVCAHIGLTPQAVFQLGGYRIQGKTEGSAQQLLDDATALEQAGAAMIVLEMVPAALATTLSAARSSMATIGIGAGADTHGQVLVLHDMLNIYPGRKARFVRNFMQGAESIEAALRSYVQSVKNGSFPASEHSY